MVSYIKGGMQAKHIWKLDPEVNIWAQEESEREVEKISMGKFLICKIQLI